MLSRRLLRVKVLQMMYAHSKKGDTSVNAIEKELLKSVSKSHELYHLILLLLLEIHKYAGKKIENAKKKKIPTPQDLNPNTKFIDNIIIHQLIANEELNSFAKEKKLSWENEPGLIKALYSKIIDSDLYNEYMVQKEVDYEYQKRFIVKLYEKIIAQHEPLYQTLEEQSIFWNDESEFVISMVIKTIKEFEEAKASQQILQEEYKDDEDKEFVIELLRSSLENIDYFTKLIKEYAKNWEFERVAYMDIILMQIALAEITEFPEIPINVSLNEYIEIAKHYSTPKSGLFINGILDKITNFLLEEGKVVKE